MNRCYTTEWADYRHELKVSDMIWGTIFSHYNKSVDCPAASRIASEVLIKYRNKYPFPDYWSFPYGKKDGQATTVGGVVLDRYVREDRPAIHESDILALCEGI